MKATVRLKSCSPYSQSKPVDPSEFPKDRNETNQDFEERTWRERCHYDKSRGNECFIPPMAFKNCLTESAQYKSIQIPGKGKTTYTKFITAGVLCVSPSYLGVTKEEVECHRIFTPASGKRGDGKRVWRYYPIFHEWEIEMDFLILDSTITKEVFETFLADAGKFIGIGRFRPRNNGYFGRFEIKKLDWVK